MLVSADTCNGSSRRPVRFGDYLAEGLDAFGLTWTDERTTPVR
jgi:hypothetical protein